MFSIDAVDLAKAAEEKEKQDAAEAEKKAAADKADADKAEADANKAEAEAGKVEAGADKDAGVHSPESSVMDEPSYGRGSAYGTPTTAAGGSAIMGAGGSTGSAIKAHIAENAFFLAALGVLIIDLINNATRSEMIYLNVFLLISVAVLLGIILLAPTKLLFGVLGVVVLGFVFNYMDYLAVSIPTLSGAFFFLIAYLILAIIGWLEVTQNEGEGLMSKQSFIGLFISLGLFAIFYFMPVIKSRFLPDHPLSHTVVVLVPAFLLLLYVLKYKGSTPVVKGLFIFYILLVVAYIFFATPLAYNLMKTASEATQANAKGQVDSKVGFDALIDDFRGNVVQTKKELSGENLHGELTDETKNLFIGVELLDPIVGNTLTFNPEDDTTIRIGIRLHMFSYKEEWENQVETSLSCYGVSSDIVKSTSEFIDTSQYSLASIRPDYQTGDILFPKDLRCTYDTASTKSQIVIVQAKSGPFTTSAYVTNNFIYKPNYEAALMAYAAQAGRATLSTPAELRSATVSIYPGLSSNVYSKSDNGPVLLIIQTNDFPVIGIDETEEGTINLKSAIANNQPSSGKVGNMKGRITYIDSVLLNIPTGLEPVSEGCPDWRAEHSGTELWLWLSQEELAKLNKKAPKLKKAGQVRLPECELVLKDADALLQKKDKPNPATFHGSITYGYEVQRRFDIKSTAKKTTSSSSSPSSSSPDDDKKEESTPEEKPGTQDPEEQDLSLDPAIAGQLFAEFSLVLMEELCDGKALGDPCGDQQYCLGGDDYMLCVPNCYYATTMSYAATDQTNPYECTNDPDTNCQENSIKSLSCKSDAIPDALDLGTCCIPK